MKPTSDMREGRDAHTRFVGAMKKILSVSKEEMLNREAEYKKQSDQNPRKRGPKKLSAPV